MEIKKLDDNQLAREYVSHAREILEELLQGRLYAPTENGIDLTMVQTYNQILQECINRHLDGGVYEECLLMCQGILSNIERLPNYRNWMAWSDWIPFLDHKLPTMRDVFEGNMNYLAMMWFENQESLDKTIALEMLETPYFDGRPLAQSRNLFACKQTFESGDYWVAVGKEFEMVAKKEQSATVGQENLFDENTEKTEEMKKNERKVWRMRSTHYVHNLRQMQFAYL
jgi:hypothetical protein